ncbi:GTP pyrophosphokinase [Streptococcus pluranimalium]|uniref:GTP pyrophosphokinase n=1 Tax=Streptococcus pluranimalium TaxID=82348 RepID=UPI001C4D432F|nr:GTP pyrophosphokinase family protein [Streptococcus pluranimalium]
MSIYGSYAPYLSEILNDLMQRIQIANQDMKEKTGFKLYEHFTARVKSEDSMLEKLSRKGYELDTYSALKRVKDSIGLRIVCGFVDDIYKTVDFLRQMPDVTIVTEKDYIQEAKPNGYRSYHLILEIETSFPDCLGNENGKYFVEIQLRTIAMDSWASLEHQMKYKHDITNAEMITRELKRCADELASCDLSMQTIRNLIQMEIKD